MPDSRRILITGLSSHWGGRLAQQLERDAGIEAIVGVDTTNPQHELHRTEFVRVDTDDALLRRIVKAAAIDTVIDTRLIPDPLLTGLRHAHKVNVLGTRSVLGACGGTNSPVRKLVFKSSAHYYGCDQDDPAFFSEDMVPRRPPRTAIEHDVVDAELAVSEFGRDNPDTTVTVLRFAGAVGGELRASHLALLNLPVVPAILGFDPRCQFIHEDDVIAVLGHAVRHDLPGSYNAAADGVLALSEVVSLLGKPLLPVLPPWGTVFAAMQLRRLGLRVPVEMLRDLRFGRGLDNRKLKATGYSYRYTTRETVQKLRAQQRLRPLLRSGSESYRYEREVEEFLRWSPSVQGPELGQDSAAAAPAADGRPASPAHSLDSLSEGELLDLIPSLETEALERLSDYEAGHRARRRVLDALQQQLARRSRAGRN
jgi:UDP-glucose 4-epimerase